MAVAGALKSIFGRRTPLAGDERGPDGAEVTAADHPRADSHRSVRIGPRQSVDVDLVAQCGAGCRQEVGQAGCLDVRQLLELVR